MLNAISTDIVFNSQNMQLNKAASILNYGQSVSDEKDDPYKLDIQQNILEKAQNTEDDNTSAVEEYFEKINDFLTNMSNNIRGIDSRLESIIEIIERLNEISKIAQDNNKDIDSQPFLPEDVTKKLTSKAVSLTQEEILKQYEEAVLSSANTTKQQAISLLS